uniref:Uncharacterized protein n=1 Tax=Salix viminalis TaxID=40686 RepID=A0A6N2JYE1_SALVM
MIPIQSLWRLMIIQWRTQYSTGFKILFQSWMSELDFVFGIACSGWLKVQCRGIMLAILAVQTIVAGTNKLLQKRESAVKAGWLRCLRWKQRPIL